MMSYHPLQDYLSHHQRFHQLLEGLVSGTCSCCSVHMECDYNRKVELVRNDDTVVQEDIDGVPERKVEDSSGSVEGLLVGGLCKVMDY